MGNEAVLSPKRPLRGSVDPQQYWVSSGDEKGGDCTMDPLTPGVS